MITPNLMLLLPAVVLASAFAPAYAQTAEDRARAVLRCLPENQRNTRP